MNLLYNQILNLFFFHFPVVYLDVKLLIFPMKNPNTIQNFHSNDQNNVQFHYKKQLQYMQ